MRSCYLKWEHPNPPAAPFPSKYAKNGSIDFGLKTFVFWICSKPSDESAKIVVAPALFRRALSPERGSTFLCYVLLLTELLDTFEETHLATSFKICSIQYSMCIYIHMYKCIIYNYIVFLSKLYTIMIQNGGCQTPWAARWARLSLNAPKPTSWAHYARPKSDCWATGKVTTTCSSKISAQELDLETFGWNPAGVLLVSFYHLQSYIPFKKVQRLRPVLQPFVSMCKSASRSRIFQPLYLRPVPVAHDFFHHCWAKLYITSPVPMAQWVARYDLKRNHTGVDGDHHRDMGEITKFMIWCNVYMCI